MIPIGNARGGLYGVVGSGSFALVARGGATNKGFARRRQRLLEGPYVAIPGCGGEWEWEGEWVWVLVWVWE